MIEAIEGATTSVALCSYIFADDSAGRLFVVEQPGRIREMTGARYTSPPVYKSLSRAGVRVARFLPIVSRSGIAFFNLRTHRKALVVDGRIGFAGGMNIHAPNVAASPPITPGISSLRKVRNGSTITTKIAPSTALPERTG